jgi:hypothetical protein
MADAPATVAPAPPEPTEPSDRVPRRILTFVGILAVILIVGFGLGRLVSATGQSTTGTAGNPNSNPSGTATHYDPPGTPPHVHSTAGTQPAGGEVGGLAVSSGGYRMVPATTTFAAGRAQDLRFRIVGPDRAPVTAFAVVNDKPLHLIVVRRDLTGYQHLHPTLAADGTWSVPVTLAEAGVWRAFADFTLSGQGGSQIPVTLGVDLTVAGNLRPQPLPRPAAQATVAGFTVAYAGTPQVGSTQPMLFSVTKAGAPVALERYLGSYGHLVVLRDGDLGYLHVHPESQLSNGSVKFWVAAPSPGTYRMFLDFQVAGAVHTAQFTLVVP